MQSFDLLSWKKPSGCVFLFKTTTCSDYQVCSELAGFRHKSCRWTWKLCQSNKICIRKLLKKKKKATAWNQPWEKSCQRKLPSGKWPHDYHYWQLLFTGRRMCSNYTKSTHKDADGGAKCTRPGSLSNKRINYGPVSHPSAFSPHWSGEHTVLCESLSNYSPSQSLSYERLTNMNEASPSVDLLFHNYLPPAQAPYQREDWSISKTKDWTQSWTLHIHTLTICSRWNALFFFFKGLHSTQNYSLGSTTYVYAFLTSALLQS